MGNQPPEKNSSAEELLQHKVWEHVEERLDKRTARMRSTFVLIAGLLGIIGVPSLYFALQSNVVENIKSDIADQTRLITEQVAKENMRIQLQIATLDEKVKSVNSLLKQLDDQKKNLDARIVAAEQQSEVAKALEKNLKDAKQGADALKAEMQVQHNEVRKLLQEMNDRKQNTDRMLIQLKENSDKATDLSLQLEATEKKASQQLASLADYSERLDVLQSRVDETLPVGGGEVAEPLAPIELSSADLDAVRVRQQVSNLDQKTDTGNRNYRLLTYSIFVDKNRTSEDPQRLLNSIRKVVYKMDPKWFSPNEYTRTNRDDNFQFTITVWGITNVAVEIQFTDGNRVFREAYMSMSSSNEF